MELYNPLLWLVYGLYMTIETLLNGHLYHTVCCKYLSFHAKVRLTTLFSISCIKILPLIYEIKHIHVSDCLLMYTGTSVITDLLSQACHLSQNTYVTYIYDCENYRPRGTVHLAEDNMALS